MNRAVADFDTLAARALNATRVTHKPSYAALRVLLRSLAKDQAAFDAFLTRRLVTREGWRYFGFQILKEGSPSAKPVYRNCVIGSPLTALAEAHVLGLMSGEPAFAVPACAYSYRWPSEPMAGRNFEYFFEGYDRRNRAVAELLRNSAGSVAVVTDVKSFYPSVSKERLASKVEDRTRRVADPAAARAIRRFARDLIDLTSPKSAGIPIGPDLSHVLGHVALEGVDAELTAAFGPRYLRYVDDIIVVCPKADVGRSLLTISESLAREGLALNKDKQDHVDGGTWHAENVLLTPTEAAASFESLLDEITLYLIRKPHQAEDLQRAFRAAGFSLPVARLRGLALSKRFRAHFRRRVSSLNRLFTWLGGLFTTPASLLRRAEEVRTALLSRAAALAAERPPESPTRRRWYVQKRRYVLNRLMYLFAPQDYGRVLAVSPNLDEFFEVRVVLSSLMSRDCTAPLSLPGRVVASVCQLWPEHLHGTEPRVTWPSAPGRAEAEAAAHFALSMSVIPPDAFLQALDGATPGARLLIEMCGRGGADRARIEPLSYLDEMNLLYETLPHGELAGLISSRFDELEDVGLDGLLLGGPSYFLPGDIPLFSA